MTKKTKPTHRIEWIKMPVNLFDDERIEELMTTKGMAGLGVYMALVIEMFRCQKHCLTLTQVKNRKYNGATKKTINQIINDYDLFTIDAYSHVNSNIDFLSVLETRHLQSEQIKNASDAQSDAHADLNPIAIGLQSDAFPSPARVIIRDRDIDKEHHLDGDDVSHPDFISQMRMDTSWAAMVMLNKLTN